jgi:transposase
MIDYELYCKMKNLEKQQGLTPAQIARELSLDARTVEKWLETGRFHQRKSHAGQSKLDPYKNTILRMLETHPYTSSQILARIREEGFDGGRTIVKDYVQKVRPPRSKAFLTLSFAPGECAQVDWGAYGSVAVGSTRRRLYFFVMVLCYSRMMYAEFTVSMAMEHFLSCHRNAFEFFGGVPKKIMTDNLKSAVLKRPLGREPVFNPKYLDFAGHYGFSIAPCNVGKGNEKGRVENAVGYIKKNFLAGLAIPDFAVLNPALRLWLDTIANVRVHGATRLKPCDLMIKEKPFLGPLPENPFDVASLSQVRASSQFRVTLDTNRYSVPARYAGRRLTVKTSPDRICIYCENALVARHARSYDRNLDFEDPDHPKELLAQRKKARHQKIFLRFLGLSERAEQYYREMEQRRLNPFHHAQKIVALSEIYSAEAVRRAMDDAFTFRAFSSEYIANLLEQRSRSTEKTGALILTRNEDLLELAIEAPDLSVYQTTEKGGGKP